MINEEFNKEIDKRLPSILLDMDAEFHHFGTYKSLHITKGHPEKPSEDDWNYLINDIIDKMPELKMTNLRDYRNMLLHMSDVYVLPDYPHKTEELRQAWLDYRQKLRDITITHPPDTFNLDLVTLEPQITWPDKPHD